MPEDEHNLTLKQEAFVCAYLQNGFNATKAAKTAGYAEDSARVTGCQNLTNPNIAEAINARLDSEGITPARIKIAIAKIAFDSDAADFEAWLASGKTLVELRAEGFNTSLVKSISITSKGAKLELYSSLDALDKLAKIHGMYTENIDVTSKGKGIQSLPGLSKEDLAILAEKHGGPE